MRAGTDRISLCVVVRNEAGFVGAAVASARHVVDEAIVVDTGSSDATPSIARRAGATVIRAPWPGDLGRAHDLPVQHASGDWVLMLDGDEVLDPASADRIRDVVERGSHDGYRVEMRNYSYGYETKWRAADPLDPLTRGASGYLPTRPVRLFRRRPGLRHTGRLHQCVAPAIRRAGGRIGDADLAVHHYGFTRFDRDKSSLYRTLATAHGVAAPQEPRSWVELGVVLLAAGGLADLPRATRAFHRAWVLGDRADAGYFLGSCLVRSGRPEAALAPLEPAIAANPDDAAGHYDRADAWEVLGQAHEDLGRPAAAESAYRNALALRPGSPVAAYNLIGLLLDTGATDAAAGLLDELAPRDRGRSEFWVLRGRLLLRRQDPLAAADAFATALDIRPDALGARVNRAVALRRAGRRQEAWEAYRDAAELLGTAEAETLGLAARLPRGLRPRPAPSVAHHEPGLVVSLIGPLAGDSGQAVTATVAALDGRPQIVLCSDAGTAEGHRLRAEMEDAGVTVRTIGTQHELERVLGRLRPTVVVHHWTAQGFERQRVGDVRWICVGHVPLPMPPGYDAYVARSRFHGQLQAHLPADRVRVIRGGVDSARFAVSRRPAAAPVTVAMLGSLDAGRFPRRLLAHLPALEGARVLIGGSGARRYELEPEIAARGLAGAVRFVGPLGPSQLSGFLGAADIGLHLTETDEPVGPTGVLAMLAAGLPLVAQPKGGLPELIADGHNGFLCADERVVAARLRELIDAPELRRRMGRASQEVASRCDHRQHRSALVALVDEVVGRPAATHADLTQPTA